jgi:hypothetical protein
MGRQEGKENDHNWDAAVDAVGRKMGVGIIIRTHEGEVMVTKCSTKPYINDP